MKEINLELSDEVYSEIEKRAEQLNVSVQELLISGAGGVRSRLTAMEERLDRLEQDLREISEFVEEKREIIEVIEEVLEEE